MRHTIHLPHHPLSKIHLLLLSMACACSQAVHAQTLEERLETLEKKVAKDEVRAQYLPKLHGILRGKYEYQPEDDASRFEVRNARLSVNGKLAKRSEYKLEVDLCDESQIKMKDAWVRILPFRTLRLSIGQQRMPFSIDAHRNPSAQFFANRSFIAKQVGDVRDVGFQVGYDFLHKNGRNILSLDAGMFNGSNLDNQITAWFSAPAYSARLQYFPVKGLAIIPSVQHQQIAERQASYTSVDIGTYFEQWAWHIEAEYLRKLYDHNAFDDCSSVSALTFYKQQIHKKHSFIEAISYLGRYDFMQDHSSGKNGFEEGTTHLALTDAERHRMTLGMTFSIRNPYFPTDLRLNYENYWYPHGGAKESERDKLVCELMIRF